MHSWAVIQRQELEAAEGGGGLLCVRFCHQEMEFCPWQQHRFLITGQIKAEKAAFRASGVNRTSQLERASDATI